MKKINKIYNKRLTNKNLKNRYSLILCGSGTSKMILYLYNLDNILYTLSYGYNIYWYKRDIRIKCGYFKKGRFKYYGK
jgi:hypothetical protein